MEIGDPVILSNELNDEILCTVVKITALVEDQHGEEYEIDLSDAKVETPWETEWKD